MTSSAAAGQQGDIRDILQIVLNDPRLARYYHFDTRPDRAPLRVVNLTSTDFGSPSLTAAGQPAIVSRERDRRAVEITAFTLSGDSASMKFELRAEGVFGDASLGKRNGAWALDSLKASEQSSKEE